MAPLALDLTFGMAMEALQWLNRAAAYRVAATRAASEDARSYLIHTAEQIEFWARENKLKQGVTPKNRRRDSCRA